MSASVETGHCERIGAALDRDRAAGRARLEDAGASLTAVSMGFL
jgi:hypothetical protein